MENLIQKMAIGAAVLAGLTGCARTNVQYNEPVQSKKEIYSSPVIKPEYGFEVISRSGNVDETKEPSVKNGKVYVVGFSTAYSTESDARRGAWRDAAIRAIRKLYGFKETRDGDYVTRVTKGRLENLSCGKYEVIGVKDSSGNSGYIAEADCEANSGTYQIPSMPEPIKGGQLPGPKPVKISKPYAHDKKPIAKETDAQKLKRETREYVKRNKINLSVLEKGEEVTGMYSLGENERNKVVFTNYAAPIVKEIDGLLNQLNRKGIAGWNSDVKNGNYSDPFDEIEQIAKDAEYAINCLDKGCLGKRYFGKADRMITGKEARASRNHLKQYLESKMKNKNINKRR